MIPLAKLQALLPPRLLTGLAVALEVNAPNQVRLPGEAVFLCLLNTLLNGSVVTQRLLEETYTRLYGRKADHSSFGKRLATLKPTYLEALFRPLYRQLQPADAPHSRGLHVRRIDATTVTASAKLLHFGLQQRAHRRAKNQTPKRHVKAVLELSEDGLPSLLRLCRDRSETNDNQALGRSMQAATQPNDLWVFDRGCKDRDRLLALHRAGSYWLTPHCGQKLRVVASVWEDPAPAADQAAVRAAQEAEARTHPKAPAPCCLQRVEQAVFENAEAARQPSQQAKWAELPLLVFHGERYNRRTEAWEPFVLLTNLPLTTGPAGPQAGPYALGEVTEVYRQRWELEVFFKFLKQHVSYAHLTSLCENGIQVMLWMALITALVLQWYRRESGIDRGWRSVKFWLAEDCRAWTEATLAPLASTRGGALPAAGSAEALGAV